jgi:hypothetical protein
MLAELAAANAAFAVIKTTIANGRELSSAATAIGNFLSAKSAIASKADKRKNSFWHKVNPQKGNDFEEFMALEEIKQKEEELKQYMIWAGRPGLWNDWLQFQRDARVRRQKEAAERELARQRLWEIIGYTVLGILGFAVLMFLVWLLITGMRNRGVI